MGYRNKTYVAFDGDKDIRYYRLMQAWKSNDRFDFNFYDAHEFNNIWSRSTEETIKRRLRERMGNAKVFVLLVGESTRYLYKYVKYEIELALSAGIPIIAVNLNGKRKMDEKLCPPVLRDNLILHIAFGPKIMEKSLKQWPELHYNKKRNGESKNYHYGDEAY